ncbi:hypothetical protein IGI04_006044 [Brassica rapa subsp. trilocularis]|uniref:Uncharacterized protein n=1 Tax=Brassica rapa subsp. trilocularis TaxID=1813537 RepID=A0ABQ7NFR5_BRACM|nr:hypothetical protein IGI04_006044 [Brassica rapa subsp. trilocularis]
MVGFAEKTANQESLEALRIKCPRNEPFAAEVWISPPADLHSVAAWINQPRVNADAHATPLIKLYFQSAIYLLWKERNARVVIAVSSPSSVILASLDRMMCDRLLSYLASSSFSSSLLLFIFLWTKKAP